jgi:DNA-directed RNA polymerase sigma subunit (sigma70/sigma32)
MGLFVTEKSDSIADLLQAAKENIDLYGEHPDCDYLIATFAANQIDKAIKILVDNENHKRRRRISEARSDESELSALLSALGVTDEWRVDEIKETAMNRFKVKNSRRAHIRQILDDAFEQLKGC